MSKKCKILGVPVDAITKEETMDKLHCFLKTEQNHIITTPNPEMIMCAQKNADFMAALCSADLVLPDGIGVVLASKLTPNKISERVTGCDTVIALLNSIKTKQVTVYLLGGKPGVVQLAKRNIEQQFPLVRVVGCNDGYFDAHAEREIIKDIKNKKPDILLVGLSFPKQELWLTKHKNRLPVKISMAVGGSLDVLAGTVQRAPLAWRRVGLEWLYRLLSQPSRAVRMLQLPLFALCILRQFLFKTSKKLPLKTLN